MAAPEAIIVRRLRQAAALAFHTVAGFRLPRAVRSDNHSCRELVEYAFSFGQGMIAPVQIRSEIERFMEEVAQLKPRRLLEIGTARGGTFFLLSRAAAPDAWLISLDLPASRWSGVTSFVLPRLVLPTQRGLFLHADSHAPQTLATVKGLLGDSRLDLLFIDGDHSYEGVKQDFELYHPLVRAGGMVAFHDIATDPLAPDCGVRRLWDEVKQTYPCREIFDEFQHGIGIGILRV